MRIKIHKNFNPTIDSFQMTKAEIESQVIEDLIHYKKLYFEKYKKIAPASLDVDNFVQELWDITVEFGKIEMSEQKVGVEILGRLEPENKKIIVDDTVRPNPKSISFTIAHEAGHLSLHASIFRLENGEVKGWTEESVITKCQNPRKTEIGNTRREWQANHYAASLLAPEFEIKKILNELGLIVNNDLKEAVDLAIHGSILDSKFQLSRQALEIRLAELQIPVINEKYPRLSK